MSMQNYVELAIKTESVISSINNIDFRMLHAAMGICTEVGELCHNAVFFEHDNPEKNRANLVGELGDVFWYVAIACDVIVLDFNKISQSKIDAVIEDCTLQRLVIKSSEILDMLKKTIYYKKAFDAYTIAGLLTDIIELSISIINLNELTLDEVLEKNINKLAARYPDKFDSYRAIHRDLDAEQKTLC